jgi:[acyl-carrier-protein] S-malonyltransferase
VLVALFPGQGSLKPQMGVPWLDHEAFGIVDEIAAAASMDVRNLLLSTPLDVLVQTNNAQIATFALSLVIARASGIHADLAIGHSLGEYSALSYAGILDQGDAARLVAARGRAMLAAAEMTEGSMLAVLGADEATIIGATEDLDTVVIANQNAPGQIVVAGSVSQLEILKQEARERGLRKVIPLDVGGAFHSPLMAPAQAQLEGALDQTTFHEGSISVVANVDATPHAGGPQWRDLLRAQLTGAVRFADSIAQLPSDVSFVELGAGGVLSGLVRRISPNASVRTIATPDDLS